MMTALEVADWRRNVFALYAAVRAASDPAVGHELWRTGRDGLFAAHPATPLLPEDRGVFTGLPVAAVRPGLALRAGDPRGRAGTPRRRDGTDGVVPFERLGRVEVPDVGSLDVWRLTSYGGGIFLPVQGCAGRGGRRHLRRRPLPPRHHQGRRSRPGPASGIPRLDFNFAYNPSCAYDPAWACPLAPAGNTVPVEIPVGELYSGVVLAPGHWAEACLLELRRLARPAVSFPASLNALLFSPPALISEPAGFVDTFSGERMWPSPPSPPRFACAHARCRTSDARKAPHHLYV